MEYLCGMCNLLWYLYVYICNSGLCFKARSLAASFSDQRTGSGLMQTASLTSYRISETFKPTTMKVNNKTHSEIQMEKRSITHKMIQSVMRKDPKPYVQIVDNGTINLRYKLNWNGNGWINVVTNHDSTFIITVKWERFSINWNKFDRSEDFYTYRWDSENGENRIAS